MPLRERAAAAALFTSPSQGQVIHVNNPERRDGGECQAHCDWALKDEMVKVCTLIKDRIKEHLRARDRESQERISREHKTANLKRSPVLDEP
jgi:hypothetical protein